MNNKVIDYFEDKLSETDRLELLKERETNDLLKKEFAEIQNLRAIVSLSKENINLESGKNSYQHFIKNYERKKVIHFTLKLTAYAAAICLLITGTWFSAIYFNQSHFDSEITQQELYVPPGQRARLVLPDNTVAWLNAGSKITYPSVFDKERKVNFTGEAYFEVAKNPDKPFIVSTDSIEIIALGTEFNVFSYPNAEYINTTLIEGSVKIHKKDDESQSVILKPEQQLLLKNGKFSLESAIDKDLLLWKDGIYSFKKERFENIIAKLELYYDTKIIVKDTSVLQFEYTGKFRQRDGVVEILSIIQKIHHFKITKNEELNQITLYR